MTDPKDFLVQVPCAVTRHGKGRFEAWTRHGSYCGVTGSGETSKDARNDLAKNLAWTAHCVGAFVAVDATGAAWICTAAPFHGHWYVQRSTPDGMSQSTAVVAAPTYSAIKAEVLTWNAVHAVAS